jgi:hypothetical protein
MENLSYRIQVLHPELESLVDFVLMDDGEGAFIAEWNAAVTQPTEAELLAVDLTATLAIIARRGAYPSIADQLDMQYHDGVDSTTTWADAIAAVKTKYPKS